MRINELLVENEQLDELSLAGIGRGIGAVAGAIGRGVGNVQGAWQGAKAAYNQNKDTAANKAARNVAHGGGAQMSKTSAPGGTAQQPAAPAPQGQAAPAGNQQTYGGEVASNNLLARAQQGTTQDPAAQQAAPAATASTAQAPAAAPAGAPPAQADAEPPATPAVEKQSKIGVGQINKIVPTLRVRDLKSVQKNVDATLQKRSQKKQPTAEGLFYSRFLGKEI